LRVIVCYLTLLLRANLSAIFPLAEELSATFSSEKLFCNQP
jgi:hypothetical protein